MKTISVFIGTVLLLMVTVASAAGKTVVVIPLGADKPVLKTGGYDAAAILTALDTYIMSGMEVSLPKDGTCVVTATGYVYSLGSGNAVRGPFFRTARQVGAGTPAEDEARGVYVFFIDGSSSTAVAATMDWDMSANTNYRFGCSFLNRPANWSASIGQCRVTWVCSED